MNRRSFIAAAAATTTTAVAGCLANGPRSTGEPTDTPTDTPTPDPTPHGPTLADTSFEVDRVACGNDYGYHDVTTTDETVTVAGVMDGRNTCYTATLVRGEYVREADTLHVAVEARETDTSDTCGMCIVEIHYTATFAFDDGTPGRIEVEQRGATTTSGSTGEHGSGSATAPPDDATAPPDDPTDTATPESADY